MSRVFRLVLMAVVSASMLFLDLPSAHADPLTLQAFGEPRPLHGPILGASTTAFFEPLLDDPAKIAVLKTMAIGLDRFPGGSDANFYNWRTGLIEIQARADSSPYVRFWVRAAANIARGMPHGVTLEQYAAFSHAIGAQVILVPNLESSSIPEQVAWFTRLAGERQVPQRLELGNEFWVAMGNDPASLARWPDAPTSMRIMKQYLEALHPFLPATVKVAVQAAAGAVDVRGGRFGQRLRQWDEALRPEPWFDAVTVHLYPRVRDVMGDPQAGRTPPTATTARARLQAMLARVDAGVERLLQDLERRLPGKEIWITEWNARGADPAAQRGEAAEPLSPAMEMLTTARMALVHLRHPAVTASLYFMLSFRPHDPHAMFVPDGHGSYAPVPAAAALRWLNAAANTGGSFQRLVQTGGQPVPGGGVRAESYLPIEGGLFDSPERSTLLVQNATSTSLSLDPAPLVHGRQPSRAETLVTPDLVNLDLQAARIETQDRGGPIRIPPFSFTRIVWNKS
ncbi:MAG: hypothetical protein ACHQ7N_21525 [Candidatus Methylomirabilales bacterium]